MKVSITMIRKVMARWTKTPHFSTSKFGLFTSMPSQKNVHGKCKNFFPREETMVDDMTSFIKSLSELSEDLLACRFFFSSEFREASKNFSAQSS